MTVVDVPFDVDEAWLNEGSSISSTRQRVTWNGRDVWAGSEAWSLVRSPSTLIS